MKNNFAISLDLCLRIEKGFSNDPHDSGGATQDGITLAVYRDFTEDPAASVDDLKSMSHETRDLIYKTEYWNKCYADALPEGVDYAVFDMGVNAGTGRSVRLLQDAVGFTGSGVDGVVGPKTKAAIAKTDTVLLIGSLYVRHEQYYRSLGDFPYFGKGWLTRNDARANGALALLRPPHAVSVKAPAAPAARAVQVEEEV